MSLRNLINEYQTLDKITIYTTFNITRNSLLDEFGTYEYNLLLDNLKGLRNPKLKNMIKSLENDRDDYTETISIDYNGVIFSLYGRYEELRTGTGFSGSSSAKEIRALDITDILNKIRNAKVK